MLQSDRASEDCGPPCSIAPSNICPFGHQICIFVLAMVHAVSFGASVLTLPTQSTPVFSAGFTSA